MGLRNQANKSYLPSSDVDLKGDNLLVFGAMTKKRGPTYAVPRMLF